MTPRARIVPLFIPHLGCPHDCVFCNQRRISGQSAPVTAADVTAALAALPEHGDYEVAFYGGSFTAIPPEQQRALLLAVQPFFARGAVGRIRVSTRPDAVDDAALALLREMRVETVELGAQSMDDAVLRKSGRGHDAAATERAAAFLRQGGFRLVLQMMMGLPGATPESDLETARRFVALWPDAVRIYPTVILRDTPLYALWRRGDYQEHSVADAVALCSRLIPLFSASGIPVIRLGLNPTAELSGGAVAGGAYHPALGELVKSRVYLEQARVLLHTEPHGASVVLGVFPGDISQMVGQHRCNLDALRAEFGLRALRVQSADVPRGMIVLLDAG